MDENLR